MQLTQGSRKGVSVGNMYEEVYIYGERVRTALSADEPTVETVGYEWQHPLAGVPNRVVPWRKPRLPRMPKLPSWVVRWGSMAAIAAIAYWMAGCGPVRQCPGYEGTEKVRKQRLY